MEISKSPFAVNPQYAPQPPLSERGAAERRRFDDETTALRREPREALQDPARHGELVEVSYRGEVADDGGDYGELLRQARARYAADEPRTVNGPPPPSAGAQRAINAYLAQAEVSYDNAELLPRIDSYV